MTDNELTLEQLEKALDFEMETFDLITNIVKRSFEDERIINQHIKVVKITPYGFIKIVKKSAA